MEIGCNYSPELMTLLQQDQAKVDWPKLTNIFEIEKEIDDIEKAILENQIFVKGMLPHILNDISCSDIVQFRHMTEIKLRELILRVNCPHIASHLWIDSIKKKHTTGEFRSSSIMKFIKRNALRFSSSLGDCPLLLENVPYHGKGEFAEIISNPLFYNSIHSQIPKINLLLDIAHAKITAYFLQIDMSEYIGRFFLNTVREIHVSGTNLIQEERNTHTHYGMKNDDYETLQKILRLTPNVKIVTLEYGGTGKNYRCKTPHDIGELREQLVELRRIVEGRFSKSEMA